MKSWLLSLNHPVERIGAICLLAAAVLALVGLYQLEFAWSSERVSRWLGIWWDAAIGDKRRARIYWGCAWSARLAVLGAALVWGWSRAIEPFLRWVRYGAAARDR